MNSANVRTGQISTVIEVGAYIMVVFLHVLNPSASGLFPRSIIGACISGPVVVKKEQTEFE